MPPKSGDSAPRPAPGAVRGCSPLSKACPKRHRPRTSDLSSLRPVLGGSVRFLADDGFLPRTLLGTWVPQGSPAQQPPPAIIRCFAEDVGGHTR